MSPEHIIWILSLLGAMLFVGVGFFGARVAYAREGPPAWTAPPPLERLPESRTEIEQARKELREQREQTEETVEEVRALEGQLRTALEEREEQRLQLRVIEADLAESVRVANDLSLKLKEDGSRNARAFTDLERRALEPDPRLEQLEARIAELEERSARHKEEAMGLRQEKASLVQELEDAERRASEAPEKDELERRTADLGMELESARAKVADLDRMREENARLRAASADHATLRSELRQLETERTQLRARAFAHPVETSPELPPAPSKPGAFEEVVQEVARSSSVRSVAIADELGFTIAGIGSDQEGLAALAGLMSELERRAQQLLPVGSIQRITMEMDHGAGVSVCPIARSDTRIALATLTVGPRPDTATLTGAIERAGELLFR